MTRSSIPALSRLLVPDLASLVRDDASETSCLPAFPVLPSPVVHYADCPTLTVCPAMRHLAERPGSPLHRRRHRRHGALLGESGRSLSRRSVGDDLRVEGAGSLPCTGRLLPQLRSELHPLVGKE